MKHHIYIASSLENAARVRELRDKFRHLGIGLTYDWTEHNGGMPYVPDDEPDLKAKTALAELNGVLSADAILVVLPGGNGTHFEFGVAVASGKPIVLLAGGKVPDGMSPQARTPCFHFLSFVDKVYCDDSAIASIVAYLDGSKAIKLYTDGVKSSHD